MKVDCSGVFVRLALGMILLIFVAGNAGAQNTADGLRQAVEQGNLAQAQRILTAKPELLDAPLDGNQTTGMMLASRYGKFPIVRMFVGMGAKVNQTRDDNNIALADAAGTGNTEIARFLIDHGADVQHRDNNGMLPLHWAARFGQINAIKLLIGQGEDINARRNDGELPLSEAAGSGRSEAVRVLLDLGANLKLESAGGHSALTWAVAHGYPDIAQTLLDRGAEVNRRKPTDGWTPLHDAAWNGQVETLKLLIKRGGDWHIKTNDGNLPIHKAAHNGQTGTIEALISAGTDPNAPNNDGNTPLHVAAYFGQVDAGRFLLAVGADPYARDKAGTTPLGEANRGGQNGFADMLYRYETELEARKARETAWKASRVRVRPGTVTFAQSKARVCVVYQNDFEDGVVGSEWTTLPNPGSGQSPLRISITPTGGRRFLGDFGSQNVRLTLNKLPPHREASVSFDLFIIRSWDGNSSLAGPDIWRLNVLEGPTLFSTTFANYSGPDDKTLKIQAYPGSYPGDHNPITTFADETNALGYTVPVRGVTLPMDAVYKMRCNFSHTGSFLALDFGATGLQELSDESWGIDNVRVIVAEETTSGAKPVKNGIIRGRARRRFHVRR